MTFNPQAFADLYQGRGGELEELAGKLGKMHALALSAFESHRQRSAALRQIGDALGGFGISLGEISETRHEIEQLSRENSQLQESSSQHALKGLLVLDKLLERQGVDADERSRLAGLARGQILDSLPEIMRQPWTVYFDQIEMIVASVDAAPKPTARARL